uniref:Uncharacterized protein n=1 Tax=Orbilia oligospora TaxID=2813651 RepID=A0A6H2U2X1_ORBOL|nr:hypothetical protein [Orbilia oligospora]QID02772.1 hypothetical protein [Orbilia oligospora]QID02883.1 hypothetical protein [Orbilia oligospora]
MRTFKNDKVCANPLQIIKQVTDGELIYNDYKVITTLIKNLRYWNNKNNLNNIASIIKRDLMSWEDFNLIYKNKTNIFKFDKSYNLLSNFIIIVSDKDIFINHLKNNLDIDINQGNPKTRGKIIRIKFRLANLDLSFWNSMYKHNCYFSEKDSNIEYLSKACFHLIIFILI